MFRRAKDEYDRGYRQGFEDALEMVKAIVRQKSGEHSEEKELKWEAIENGKIHTET